MQNTKYKTHTESEYGHIRFETTNLNPFGKTNQDDGIYQVLKVMRPELSDKEILKIITNERIRRAEMDLSASIVDRIIKDNIPGYAPIKVKKQFSLQQILDKHLTGKIIVRFGKTVIACDADTGAIYTGLSELYAMRPVSVYWVKEDAIEE